MKKKAIFLDLDNTIYPVSSIGDKLFKPVFDLIEQSNQHIADMPEIKKEIMRKPFQQVAKQFGFDNELTNSTIEILKNLSYDDKMEPYADYAIIKAQDIDKFLITTGFSSMQQSKVKALGLEKDFVEIHIIDPEKTHQRKADIFSDIMNRHQFTAKDVVVIGDDAKSEISSGNELGIETILVDRLNLYAGKEDLATYIFQSMQQIPHLIM